MCILIDDAVKIIVTKTKKSHKIAWQKLLECNSVAQGNTKLNTPYNLLENDF